MGMTAFLPLPPSPESTLTKTFTEAPHLPLVPDFFEANFSAAAVLPTNADPHAFAVQLIHRYRYMIGRTTSGFIMLNNKRSVRRHLLRLRCAARSSTPAGQSRASATRSRDQKPRVQHRVRQRRYLSRCRSGR